MKKNNFIKSSIPLVLDNDENFPSIVRGCCGKSFLVMPEYSYLPDYENLSDEEKEDYFLKNIDEGLYITGCTIISDKWVNKGFCGYMIREFGLIIDEAFPLKRIKSEYSEECLIEIRFKHICFEHMGMELEISEVHS